MITLVPIEPVSEAHGALIVAAFNRLLIDGGGQPDGWGYIDGGGQPDCWGYGWGYGNGYGSGWGYGRGYGSGDGSGDGWGDGGTIPDEWRVE
jgi:hypothetical protein